jgi:mannose-1-phosphate guanylyltransferase
MNEFLLSRAVEKLKREKQVAISYLPEGTTPLGTAGGIYKFRGQIEAGGIDCFFVLNSDICADFPLEQLLMHHSAHGDGSHLTIMSVKARKEQAVNYGNLLVSPDETLVQHYQEKSKNPESMGNYAEINSGVYVLSPGVFTVMNKIVTENYKVNAESPDAIGLEQDVFPRLAGSQLFAYRTASFWSQIKTAGSAIYANRHYLAAYRTNEEAMANGMLASGTNIVGDVWIHESAVVDPSAKLGPNVSIGAGATIGAGARVRDSILLDSVSIGDHCVVLNSIIDRRSTIGAWGRVEGSKVGVNPNDPTTHEPPKPLFSDDGRLNPLVTIVGCETKVAEGAMVLSVICMPHKELGARKYANQIIL